jgi:hypothetical protein
MTDLPMSAPGAPRALLSSSRDLTRKVRAAQRGTWFPLLLFGVLTFGALPVDRYSSYRRTCRTSHGGTSCWIYSNWSFVYWPAALVVAYVAVAAFYLRRSRNRGVGTRVQPYVIAGVVLALGLTTLSIWMAHNPPRPDDILGLHLQANLAAAAFRLVAPTAAIGLALLMLSRVERSWALLVFALLYLVIVVAGVDFGWVEPRFSVWRVLPHTAIAGFALLLGAVGFAAAERRSL